jgi:hypothetical protein
MSLCSRVLRAVALSAVILVPAVAYADTDGAAGTVSSVTVNESSADDYAAERGNVYVLEGATPRKYTWGGQACSGRNVSEANIALLFEAMRARDSVQVVPSYKTGGGGVRCLVGFKLQPTPTGTTQ